MLLRALSLLLPVVTATLHGVYYRVIGTAHFNTYYVQVDPVTGSVRQVGSLGDVYSSYSTSCAAVDGAFLWPYPANSGDTDFHVYSGSSDKLFRYSNYTIALGATSLSSVYALTSHGFFDPKTNKIVIDDVADHWLAKIDAKTGSASTLGAVSGVSSQYGTAVAFNAKKQAFYYFSQETTLTELDVTTIGAKNIAVSWGSVPSKVEGLYVAQDSRTLLALSRDRQFGLLSAVSIDSQTGSTKEIVKVTNSTGLNLGSSAYDASTNSISFFLGYNNQPGAGLYRIDVGGAKSTRIPLTGYEYSAFGALAFA